MVAEHRRAWIHRLVVTADQMQRIEGEIFDRGMPVPALMEKVAGLIAAWVVAHFPLQTFPQVGVLVGPGHNGGDALVVARELWLRGYDVIICCPLSKSKPLTADHMQFARSLGIPIHRQGQPLQSCSLFIDGLFGFGLERPLEGDLANLVEQINRWPQPVVSIDLPSGIHTDTGAVLGTAIAATHTLCLGLWKRAFCQSQALTYLGQRELIDFDIPPDIVEAELSPTLQVQRVTQATALALLPLPRQPDTHKYRVGHLLVVAGSRRFAGAAILTGLGARASGVGMITLVVPESLRLMVVGQIPEALVMGGREGETGAMVALPEELDLVQYDAIACGPGLSQQALPLMEPLLAAQTPLVLDADGLNLLTQLNPLQLLPKRSAPTLLTPHPGEFKRLFPEIAAASTPGESPAQTAAAQSRAVVLLKGACTAIAHPDGRLRYIADSTPALARGGSGDVLTGLVGGLMAQYTATAEETSNDLALKAAMVAAWWHAQAARVAATERTQLGVDGTTLVAYLHRALGGVGA